MVPGWTVRELQEVLEPLYPRAAEVEDPNQLVPLLEKSIRRVPNPAFISRFVDDPHEAAEYLFDRTDALIRAALRWGGVECRLHAMLADVELGDLRDGRFLLPMLKCADHEQRLRAVACTALLCSDVVPRLLEDIARDDGEPGIRESAQWANAFAAGANQAKAPWHQ
jgi:hypothetical protein